MPQKITVSTEELLAILEANRDKHRTVFEAALAGWRKAALKAVEECHSALERGKIPDLYLAARLPLPEDHTRDYDRVIRMVNMHQSDRLDMDEQMFASYVQDDWGWKRQWLTTSNSYAAGTVSQAYGEQEED